MCGKVAAACSEGSEHGGYEQRHLAAGFLERGEEEAGVMRPAEALAALVCERARFRTRL